MATTPTAPGRIQPDDGSHRERRGHIGRIVAGSLATGLFAAVLLVLAPFTTPDENHVTGAALCGFAVGWAMLAVLSTRYTDQPQRWAVVPALLMGVGGVLLLAFGDSLRTVLNWVWPPVLLALVVWIYLKARRQLHSSTRFWLLYPVLVVLALAAIGGAYETVREHADATAYPMTGQLIDVGGHRIHLNCTGSGSPTVVLQPGGGDFSSVWARIAPAVAGHTRVCVYDRPGRGWSEPTDRPQDAAQVASDLHTLLQRAHVPGPYVLAGHSFGGLYVLTHADRYPDDVAGMVLIDSTNPATQAVPANAKAYDTSSFDAATSGSQLSRPLPRESASRAWSGASATATCPRSRVTRSAPRTPPPPTPPAGSTSSSRPTPPGQKPSCSPALAPSRWLSSPPAPKPTPPMTRLRTSWRPSLPTARTASSRAPATSASSPTSCTPRRPPRPSSMSCPQPETADHCLSDHRPNRFESIRPHDDRTRFASC